MSNFKSWSTKRLTFKTDKEKLESAAKELSNKIMPIGAKMYQQSAPKSDEKSDDKKDNKDDDAVEGEVVK